MITESQKKEYSQYSAESIKRILGILDRIKEEWDLTPKKTEMSKRVRNLYVGSYDDNLNTTTISPHRFISWIRECGLKDFYQLNNILNTLKQENIITDFDFTSESR